MAQKKTMARNWRGNLVELAKPRGTLIGNMIDAMLSSPSPSSKPKKSNLPNIDYIDDITKEYSVPKKK
jgi:hypothetical protein